MKFIPQIMIQLTTFVVPLLNNKRLNNKAYLCNLSEGDKLPSYETNSRTE